MTKRELTNIVTRYMWIHGLTQKDVADELNITQNTLSRYLKGQRKMPLEVGLALLRNMGYKIIEPNESE